MNEVTTSSILADGSAQFTDDVEVESSTAATFSVEKTGAGNGRLTFDGDVFSLISNAAGASLALGTASVARQTIDYAGNVDFNSNIQLNADGSATFAGAINGETIGTSDERFKENITPASPQLADVTALGGILKNFDWNADAPVNEEIRATRQLGLVAQEVAEICPQLVKTVKRTKTVEVEPEVVGPLGKVIKEAVTEEVDDSYLALSTNALIMKLIGAVAELQAEVTALKLK